MKDYLDSLLHFFSNVSIFSEVFVYFQKSFIYEKKIPNNAVR